jgi:hypothetical protein
MGTYELIMFWIMVAVNCKYFVASWTGSVHQKHKLFSQSIKSIVVVTLVTNPKSPRALSVGSAGLSLIFSEAALSIDYGQLLDSYINCLGSFRLLAQHSRIFELLDGIQKLVTVLVLDVRLN